MDNLSFGTITNFIWGIADDCLRDVYVRGKYRDVILPMTVIRRLDAVLEKSKPAVLEKLLALIEQPVSNLVMAFDCVSLQNLGQAAKTGLGTIKDKGILILLDNTEKVSMTTLSELEFDYIRIDSRYYELGNFKAEGFLRLLTQFAKEQGVPTVATFCDNEDMAEFMFYMGIDIVQGNAISRPQRTVPNAVSKMTLLESMTQPE